MIKTILPLLIAVLLLSSCREEYNCVCVDQRGVGATTTTEVKAGSLQRASEKCADRQTEINNANTSFSCHIEQ